MGNLVWHDLSRLIAITASIYTIWSGYWGLFYRKFFWDFIGGILRNPGGLQPSPKILGFVNVIVKVPIIQILAMIVGVGLLALEWPLPLFKGTALHRSMPLRIILLVVQAFLTVLYYQGTNAALYSLIAAGAYTRAVMLDETYEEAKSNRGQTGAA